MQHKTNYSLKKHNTLKIDVLCDNYFVLESQDDIHSIASTIELNKDSFIVLGQGANVLFIHDYQGSIIQTHMDTISHKSEDDESVVLSVDAGVVWQDLVAYAVEHNLGGIENMALIPGLVGAAPVGNIAAYGQNFSDVCNSVVAYSVQDQKIVTLSHNQCGFAYRTSNFKSDWKSQYIVLQVDIRLNKNPHITQEYWSKKHGSVGDILSKNATEPYSIKDVYNAIVELRTAKFPDMTTYGTAGSFFKNPVVSKTQLAYIREKVPDIQYYPVTDLHYVENQDDAEDYVKVAAGEILDTGMGYKGKWEGNVGLFEKHALVLVTNGKATGKEVDDFASHVEKDFKDFTGVPLEREVITIS